MASEPLLGTAARYADAPPPPAEQERGVLARVGYETDDPAELCCYIGFQAVMFTLGFLSLGICFTIGALTPFCYSCCCEEEAPEGMSNNCCGCARSYPKHRIDQMFWCANVVMAILTCCGATSLGHAHVDDMAAFMQQSFAAIPFLKQE